MYVANNKSGVYVDEIFTDENQQYHQFFHVDSLAAPVVALLKKKGYNTSDSCAGHFSNGYLEDDSNDIETENVPHISSLPYILIRNQELKFNFDNQPSSEISSKEEFETELNKIMRIKYYKYLNKSFVMDIKNRSTSLEELNLTEEDNDKHGNPRFVCRISPIGYSMKVQYIEECIPDPYAFYKDLVCSWSDVYNFFNKYLVDADGV